MKKILSVALALVLLGGIALSCRANTRSETGGLSVTRTGSGAVIKNGYDESVLAVAVIAEYDSEKKVKGVSSQKLRLESGEEQTITLDSGGIYKVFVWDSISQKLTAAAEEKNSGKYKVDYSGQKSLYMNAKDEYAAGEEVVLYYKFIATDTNYSFYLDNESINYGYDDDKGFVISFTMPDHDVTLICSSKNTMVYEPDKEEEIMLVDYYRATVATVGGDGYDEAVLYTLSDNALKLCTYHKYEGDEEEQTQTYIVPYEALEKCMEVIEKNKFREWKDRDDTFGITGANIVVKFREDDGSYVRVSSEAMPMDGSAAMDEVGAVLMSYAKNE